MLKKAVQQGHSELGYVENLNDARTKLASLFQQLANLPSVHL